MLYYQDTKNKKLATTGSNAKVCFAGENSKKAQSTVVIILQHRNVSNQHVVHLKLTRLWLNDSSVKN